LSESRAGRPAPVPGDTPPGERLGQWRLFLTAVQYFTRIPVPAWVGHSPGQLNAAARWFPAVGVVVGLVGAIVYAAVAPWSTPWLGLALAFAATAWLTGAFHEDGLADTVDGLGGGYTRERALEIMKDSRIGTYGALALVLCIAVKLSALAAAPSLLPWALVAGHAVSRWLAVTIIATQDYVRDDDSARAKPLAHAIGGPGLAIATLCGLLPLVLVGPAAVVGLAAALVARWRLAALFQRRLGGYTGDCLGAAQQACEAAFYVGLVLGGTLAARLLPAGAQGGWALGGW
jgi:adenosylcobinamide-GDP ribazoletransferase